MNCTELFVRHAREHPGRMAVWLDGEAVSFGALADLAARSQRLCRRRGVGPGDPVLVMEPLGPRLYAHIIGLLGLGATVVLVEPWMPVARIERVVGLARPKLFLGGWLAQAWGARVAAVRDIPTWQRGGALRSEAAGPLHVERVDPAVPGIITFTSGTTGEPKGVVRGQGYLVRQHEVLSQNLATGGHPGPDLCIFANFVLTNLASGRGSVVVPPAWTPRQLRGLDALPRAVAPETLTCGPGFLARLMAYTRLPSLRAVHVGGAPTDCDLLAAAIARWPAAHWVHLYGSSEAEPVALVDARRALEASRARGLFQTLLVGHPVPEIHHRLEANDVWVAGPHVCPAYVGNEADNARDKRQDDAGTLWHRMGDRLASSDAGWWYDGRSGQAREDFALEQAAYAHLQSSAAFVHRRADGARFLVGEGVARRQAALRHAFPQLHGVAEARIHRDRRHRARIDRAGTLRKEVAWLAG
jgi:acyl-CoA synthetase (AMP-forming)/AMP-acid ligase II